MYKSQDVCSVRTEPTAVSAADLTQTINAQVHSSEDAELIRKQRFGLFIALALAREQYELWERMQVCSCSMWLLFGPLHTNACRAPLLVCVPWHCTKKKRIGLERSGRRTDLCPSRRLAHSRLMQNMNSGHCTERSAWLYEQREGNK